jgi:hypothetical protein
MVTNIKPDQQDYEAIERQYGWLPESASVEQRAHHYQLAQVAKLIRLYGQAEAQDPAIENG